MQTTPLLWATPAVGGEQSLGSTVAQEGLTSEFDEAIATLTLQDTDSQANLETEADQTGLIAQVVTLDLLKVALPRSIALPEFERGIQIGGANLLRSAAAVPSVAPPTSVRFSVALTPAPTTGAQDEGTAERTPIAAPAPATTPVQAQEPMKAGGIDVSMLTATRPTPVPSFAVVAPVASAPNLGAPRPEPTKVASQTEGEVTVAAVLSPTDGLVPTAQKFVGLYRNTGQGRPDDHAAIMALGPEGPERLGGSWRNSEFPDVRDVTPAWAQKLGIPPEFHEEAATFFEKLQGEVKRIVQLPDAGKVTLDGLQKALNEFLSDPRIQWGLHCGTPDPGGRHAGTEIEGSALPASDPAPTESVAGAKPATEPAGEKPVAERTPSTNVATDRPKPQPAVVLPDSEAEVVAKPSSSHDSAARPAVTQDPDSIESAGTKQPPIGGSPEKVAEAREPAPKIQAQDKDETPTTDTPEPKADVDTVLAPKAEQPHFLKAHHRTLEAALDPTATDKEAAKQAVLRSMAEIADRIQDMVLARRPGTVSVRLNPEDLGTIDVTVRHAGSRFDVDVRASDSRVGVALSTNSQELAQSVQSRGMSLGSFDVNHGQSDGRHQQGQLSRDDFAKARALTEDKSPVPTKAPSQTVGRAASLTGWAREIDYKV